MGDLDSCITFVTEDTRETAFLFQCLSMALQCGLIKMPEQLYACLVLMSVPAASCWWVKQ